MTASSGLMRLRTETEETILMKILRDTTNCRMGWIVIALFWFAFTASTLAQESTVQLQVTPEDQVAATIYTSNIRYHLHLANTPAARVVTQDFPNPNFKQSGKARLTLATTVPAPPQPAFYPQDMFKVVPTVRNHYRSRYLYRVPRYQYVFRRGRRCVRWDSCGLPAQRPQL
jgi:hypothetical protein